MKPIHLPCGRMALVDDSDYDRVMQYRWCCMCPRKGYYYACRRMPGKKPSIEYMHRFILGAAHGQEVDHINHCGLDNRRSNLRIASRSQNQANSRKPITGKASKYKGVVKTKYGTWNARIRNMGKREGLGCYKTEEDAAIAYNKRAVELHGEFARLNDVPTRVSPSANNNLPS